MKIGKYIFELLHQHDCVIVPQFGGFVARYKNATIHPVQHLFSPPSKIVAFNSELTTNDGLLANYISQKLLLSYTDSCKLINDFVTLCKAQLETNQRLQIEKIGVLFFDPEKNLQFIPADDENFLTDSFGLSTVQSPAIQRDRPFEIFNNKDAAVQPAPKRTNHSKLILKIAAYTGVAALIAFAYFNPAINSKITKGLATIFPVTAETDTHLNHGLNNSKQEQKSKEDLILSETPVREKNIYETEKPTADTSASQINDSKPEKENTSVEEEPLPQPVIESKKLPEPEPTVSNYTRKYYVVGGCFSVYDNALNLNAELKSKGFSSALIGKNKNGLEIVAIASVATKTEAEEALHQAQDSGYKDAWIMRK